MTGGGKNPYAVALAATPPFSCQHPVSSHGLLLFARGGHGLSWDRNDDANRAVFYCPRGSVKMSAQYRSRPSDPDASSVGAGSVGSWVLHQVG